MIARFESTAEYDKFKDVTRISISPVFVIKPNPTGFQFGLMGGYKGKIPIVPKTVLGIFYSVSVSEYRKYEISRSVIFLADGERIDLGTATHAVDFRNGFYIEAMLIDIPFETLQKISRAKNVEAQIGSTEFVEGSNGSKKQSKKSQEPTPLVRLTLTYEQEYHDEVFRYMSGLTHTVERHEEIPVNLGRFPNSPTFKTQGITLHRWIHYHYSNFLINVVSIHDTSLLLTNAVFLLGLSPRNCSEENVVKNRRVKRTRVKSAIDKIKEVTKSYREPRNLYVHGGVLPNLGQLDEYESLRFIHEAQEKLEISAEPIMPIWSVDQIYKSERRKLIQTLRCETKKIVEAVSEYLDTLEPVYSAIAKNLDETKRVSN
jgi:hypothetical protein